MRVVPTVDRFDVATPALSAEPLTRPACRRSWAYRSERTEPDARSARRSRPAAPRPLPGCVVPGRRLGSQRLGPRRLGAAVYRRRRCNVTIAVAVAAVLVGVVLKPRLGGAVGVTVLGAVFHPFVAVPAWVACGLGLVRWSAGGSRRPASSTPSVGAVVPSGDALPRVPRR